MISSSVLLWSEYMVCMLSLFSTLKKTSFQHSKIVETYFKTQYIIHFCKCLLWVFQRCIYSNCWVQCFIQCLIQTCVNIIVQSLYLTCVLLSICSINNWKILKFVFVFLLISLCQFLHYLSCGYVIRHAWL